MHLGDWVSEGGGCDAAVTAFGRLSYEHDQLLYGRRIVLKLIGTVYKG